MGVPSFYRWLAERYPLVVEQLPDAGCSSRPDAHGGAGGVDNLYIDMNGVIHPCFHPEGGAQPKSEREVFEAILKYVDGLLQLVRPRRLLYLAVDGPAPRAKMNQQRSRRFKSAKEAAEARREKGGAAADATMDSNVITPGTQFMATLGRWLRHYAYARLNQPAPSDSPQLRIIVSDASVPGEGEHKIMSFIRAQRHAPAANPNLHHCIHGLDADLIMLALATHEPHFTILRELVLDRKAAEKRKERQDKGEDLGPMPLQMLQIWTLREYLHREFCDADFSSVPGGYDLERVIDDFVFLCFFVGNDFLPHIPALEIHDGAIDMLMCAYKALMPQLKGYDSGRVSDSVPHTRSLTAHPAPPPSPGTSPTAAASTCRAPSS